MNSQEAKLILRACRPHGQDREDTVMREAMDLACADPDLGLWLAKEQSFDAAISAKLATVPVPANLKAEILAGRHVIPPQVFWRDMRTVLSAAAAVMLAAIVVWRQDAPRAQRTFSQFKGGGVSASVGVATLASFRSDMADSFAQMQSVGFTPDLRTSSPDRATKYFAENVSAGGGLDVHQIVDQLDNVRLFGCRIADWRGQKVSMICLDRDGQTAHLFVVNKAALTDHEEIKEHAIEFSGGYPVSAWKEGDNAFVLVGHDRDTDLTKFF